jgi:hypothetical protein
MALNSRAREAELERRAPPADRPDRPARAGWAALRQFLFRYFPSDVGQPSDPQSDRPAGAAWAALWLLAAVDGDNGCHP